jgi:hypothetical protein
MAVMDDSRHSKGLTVEGAVDPGVRPIRIWLNNNLKAVNPDHSANRLHIMKP